MDLNPHGEIAVEMQILFNVLLKRMDLPRSTPIKEKYIPWQGINNLARGSHSNYFFMVKRDKLKLYLYVYCTHIFYSYGGVLGTKCSCGNPRNDPENFEFTATLEMCFGVISIAMGCRAQEPMAISTLVYFQRTNMNT